MAIDDGRNHFFLKVFLIWFVWIFTGTLVYAYRNDLGWGKGLYMAVNVGYSIGWGYPIEKDDAVIWYSIFHLLVGATAVAAGLGYFAQNAVASSKHWYQTALTAEEHERAESFLRRFGCWIQLNAEPLKLIGIWVVWIIMMIIFYCSAVKNNFTQGLYFALSSLSTGGLWAIPSDSESWKFAVVGLFSASGVPLMGLAMSSAASLFINFGDPDEAKNTICSKVTQTEIEMMTKFGLDDGDDEITKAEYILLCCVRLGALDPSLIQVINTRFNELDSDKSGSLSKQEILEDYELYRKTLADNVHVKDSLLTDEEANENAVQMKEMSNPMIIKK